MICIRHLKLCWRFYTNWRLIVRDMSGRIMEEAKHFDSFVRIARLQIDLRFHVVVARTLVLKQIQQ